MTYRRILLYVFILLLIVNVNGQNRSKILVFAKTEGYRHKCIPVAKKAFKEICKNNNWEMRYTENAEIFQEDSLINFSAIVFLHTSGDVLNSEQEKAFKKYFKNGGGFLGVHSATTTEYDWRWYQRFIGASFIGHPPVQKGVIIIEDKGHKCVPASLDSLWLWEDEWYSFNRNPRRKMHIIMSVDEKSYSIKEYHGKNGQALVMGDHPIVWSKKVKKGRMLQTALGHMEKSYRDVLFIEHLTGALNWVLSQKEYRKQE